MSGSQGYLAWDFVHAVLWSSADFTAGIVVFVFSFLPDTALGLSVPCVSSFPSCYCFPGFSLAVYMCRSLFFPMFGHFNFLSLFLQSKVLLVFPFSLLRSLSPHYLNIGKSEKINPAFISLSLPSVLWQFLQSRYAAFCDSESSVWLPFTWASEGFLLISVLFSS